MNRWLVLALLGLAALAFAEPSAPQTDGQLFRHLVGEASPRVSYIVPWQEPLGPSAWDEAFASELDSLFEPLDRMPFLREMGYRRALQRRQ